MNKYILNTLGLTAILALCAIAWGAWRVGVLADSVKVPDLSATVAKANSTLDVASATFASVNRPCAPGPCGTLAEANKAIVKVGDAIVTTQLQERAIAPATVAAVDSLATIAPHINPVFDSTRIAIDKASGTIDTINVKIGPMFDAYTQLGNNLNATLAENRLHIASTLANVDGITANGNGILADVKVETDQMVKPKTKAQRIFSYAPVTLKLAAEVACLTTGTPCP